MTSFNSLRISIPKFAIYSLGLNLNLIIIIMAASKLRVKILQYLREQDDNRSNTSKIEQTTHSIKCQHGGRKRNTLTKFLAEIGGNHGWMERRKQAC
jgi:hypothetical protein